MANMKAGGLVLVVTMVVTLLESIFIPMISNNLVSLKSTAPDAGANLTLDNSVRLLYLLPLGTIIGGVIVAFGVGLKG